MRASVKNNAPGVSGSGTWSSRPRAVYCDRVDLHCAARLYVRKPNSHVRVSSASARSGGGDDDSEEEEEEDCENENGAAQFSAWAQRKTKTTAGKKKKKKTVVVRKPNQRRYVEVMRVNGVQTPKKGAKAAIAVALTSAGLVEW